MLTQEILTRILVLRGVFYNLSSKPHFAIIFWGRGGGSGGGGGVVWVSCTKTLLGQVLAATFNLEGRGTKERQANSLPGSSIVRKNSSWFLLHTSSMIYYS